MFLSALVCLLVVAAPSPEGWSTYANDRYGYAIGIPPGLVGQGEAANGDGQEFKDASGKVSLKAWASLVVELSEEPEDKMDLRTASSTASSGATREARRAGRTSRPPWRAASSCPSRAFEPVGC